MNTFKKSVLSPSGVIHLNNAGIGPTSLAAVEASAKILDHFHSYGFFDAFNYLEIIEEQRRKVSLLVKTSQPSVSFIPNVSTGISQLAYGIPLERGDEILTWLNEYPSNAYAWHFAAKAKGATVVSVPFEKTYSLSMEKFLNSISSKTRVVAISWVQFNSGFVSDLKEIGRVCREKDIWFVVDAIQGLGVIPMDMDRWGIDAICSGTYKWLCGPLGQSFLVMNPKKYHLIEPIIHGAFTYGLPYDPVDPNRDPQDNHKRFEPGAPAVNNIVAAGAAIQMILNEGVESLHQEALGLSLDMQQRLEDLGNVHFWAGAGTPSPIFIFEPDGNIEKICESLNRQKVTYSRIGDRLRFSPHAFNTKEEIEKVSEIIRNS